MAASGPRRIVAFAWHPARLLQFERFGPFLRFVTAVTGNPSMGVPHMDPKKTLGRRSARLTMPPIDRPNDTER